MQSGEAEFHLGLDGQHPHHLQAAGPVGGVVAQRRLADPRLAAQDE
jgi:hypothetical protein